MKIVSYMILLVSFLAFAGGIVTMADKAVAMDRISQALHIGEPAKREAKFERGEINWAEIDATYLKSNATISGSATKLWTYAGFVGLAIGVSMLRRSGGAGA